MIAEVSNKADWTVQIYATDDETGTPIDFAGADIHIEVQNERDCRQLSASTDSGNVTTPGAGIVEFKFGKDEMKRLCPATYKIGGIYTLNDETNQLFVGEFTVYDGIVSS